MLRDHRQAAISHLLKTWNLGYGWHNKCTSLPVQDNSPVGAQVCPYVVGHGVQGQGVVSPPDGGALGHDVQVLDETCGRVDHVPSVQLSGDGFGHHISTWNVQ